MKTLWLWYLHPDKRYFSDEKKNMMSTLGSFLLFPEEEYTTRKKYTFLKYVLENQFLTLAEKNDFLALFNLIQKHYFAFSRFAYLWKWKRAAVAIETDLFLNKIDAGKHNCFVMFQGGKTKFHFVISDLMRLMEMAIWHNWESCFRVISQIPTNPYTKQTFRTVDLYNIYYHMKTKMDILIPQFFHLWFLDDFCFTTFKRNNDQYIRKMCIRHFTKTTSNKNPLIYRNVREMLSDYVFTCNWKIHENFPKDVLVDAMRPYLYLHYLVIFDIVSFRLASYYEIVLQRELLRFYHFNPSFGKKYITSVKQFKHSDFFMNEEIKAPVYQENFHTETPEFSSWHF